MVEWNCEGRHRPLKSGRHKGFVFGGGSMYFKKTLTRIRNCNAGGVVYTSGRFRRCQLKPICMRLLFLLSVSVLQLSAVSLAAPATFNIDPGRSTLVLSGDGLEAWSWGSTDDPVVHNGLSTSYAGTIVVDRDAAAGTFDITHGGLLAQDIPGFASGPPNSSPSSGNYLFFSQLSSDFFASSTFQGAIRDFSFS